MPKAKQKRRRCGDGDSECGGQSNINSKYQKTDIPVCIIHDEGIHSPGRMTMIKDLKEPESRFKEICCIRDRRMTITPGSAEQRKASCSCVPQTLESHHGYHRKCYSRFINHLEKLPNTDTPSVEHLDKIVPITDTPEQSSSHVTYYLRSSSHMSKHHNHKKCIFCKRKGSIRVKIAGAWIHEAISQFEFGGMERVLDTAKKTKR